MVKDYNHEEAKEMLKMERLRRGYSLIEAEELARSNAGRRKLLVANLFIYPSNRAAVRASGYSESYAGSQAFYRMMRSAKFQQELRDHAIANDILSLPQIARIEGQVLKHLEKSPLDINKYYKTIQQKKEVAGVLRQDTVCPAPTVSVDKLLVIQKMTLKMLQEQMGEEDVDL